MQIIIEVENTKNGADGSIVVKKDDNGVYHVFCDGTLRHTPCSAEDVMRALGNYLQSAYHSK